MTADPFLGVPGAELVVPGLADLRAGRETANALLVAIGAPRLRDLGLDVPDTPPSPEHRLYELLAVTEATTPTRPGTRWCDAW